MSSEDSPVIVHAHLFKNAGSTIDWILKKNFKWAFLDDRNDDRMRMEPGYMGEVLRENKGLKAISSHSIRLPLADVPGYRFHLLFFLRHPVARVRSVYDFERKQNAKTPGAVKAKELSFSEYVRWRLRDDVPKTIRNFHTSYLTACVPGRLGLSSNELLKSAINLIECTPLVGLVEYFDASMAYFKCELENDFPGIDLSYEIQNSSRGAPVCVADSVKRVRDDLGESLYAQFLEKNEADLLLYNAAEEILKARWKLGVGQA
ncbi:hypothetical protein GCM10008090_04920 [Arenicella chitinivorans]|uniref:Sulfotransferase family protein n=1 Tax=Arenicella chitinivorans TaxID=1329800 RepID=A0A918RIH1_9GAMM|nr:hypothetical protein [Arenicella chitinivorans]GGZ99354.1 hypothetical protein GCM10008090_04920 [Arenicella chitinivorans]